MQTVLRGIQFQIAVLVTDAAKRSKLRVTFVQSKPVLEDWIVKLEGVGSAAMDFREDCASWT